MIKGGLRAGLRKERQPLGVKPETRAGGDAGWQGAEAGEG